MKFTDKRANAEETMAILKNSGPVILTRWTFFIIELILIPITIIPLKIHLMIADLTWHMNNTATNGGIIKNKNNLTKIFLVWNIKYKKNGKTKKM